MNTQGFAYSVLPVFTNTMILEWPYPVHLSNCSMASGCLGYRLFHISSSTFLFTRGPSLSAAPALLRLEHIKCLIGPTLCFFVSFVINVTATSHHAISMLTAIGTSI